MSQTNHYQFFLKLYGLKGIIASPNEGTYMRSDGQDINVDSVELQIGSEGITTETHREDDKWYHAKKIRLLVNWSYITFIFAAILWPIVYGIVKAGVEREWKYFTSNTFSLMFACQHFFGIMYYQTNHYIEATNRVSLRIIKISLLGCLALSTLWSFICVILLTTGINFNTYSTVYDGTNTGGRTMLCILLFINTFYSLNIFLINALVFVTIFVSHSYRIVEFDTKMGALTEQTEDISIRAIIEDYSVLKSEHTSSVIKTNNLFSSIIIIGLLSSYFIFINFNTKFVGVLTYTDVVLFLIITGIYISTITRVTLYTGSIKSTVGNSRFIGRFLSRTHMDSLQGDVYKAAPPLVMTKDELSVSITHMETTPSVENSDGESDSASNSTEILRNDQRTSNIDNLALRTQITCRETLTTVDWLALNTKLSGSWENFKVMGIDIQNDDIIKKFCAVVIGLFGVFEVTKHMGWS